MIETEQCRYCAAEMPIMDFINEEQCPSCGIVWYYDEGRVPTMDSLRALVRRAVADERERCLAITLDEGHERIRRVEAGEESIWGVHRAIAARIREGGAG